jgi:predicted nucleic acid-binding Zn ribbon protein
MERASHTLERLLAEAVGRTPAEQLPQAAWEFACGPAVAARTRVLAIEERQLVVEVEDANWRAQLESMAPQLLARLRQVLQGEAAIQRIDFRLAAHAEDKERRQRRRKPSQ